MFKFRPVIYSRLDKPDGPKNGKIIASAFPSELSVKGKKIQVGVYKLVNEIDVAGSPEPKKKDTKTKIKNKSKGKGK